MHTEDIQLLYDYNCWANVRILRAAAGVPGEQFASARLGYCGLRDTLVHMFSAERRWRALAGEGADVLGEALIRAWDEPQRRYHDQSHLIWLLDEAKRRVALVRDRTFVGESGRKYPGTEIVGTLWDRGLAESLGPRREQNLTLTLREIERALDARPARDTLLDEFHEHGSIRPSDDGLFAAAGTY